MVARLTLVMLVGVCGAQAVADDLLPPDWRGEDRTTMQEWQFSVQSDAEGYWYPEVADNDAYQGGGINWYENLRVSGGSSWADVDPASGRQGIVVIDPDVVGALQFQIPNVPILDDAKDIRIQITSWGDTPALFEIIGWLGQTPNPYLYRDPMLPIAVLDGGAPGWTTSVYDFSLDMNPLAEQIEIWWDPSVTGVLIDQVVIDTRCTPEPATLCLLALGGLGVIRRRR